MAFQTFKANFLDRPLGAVKRFRWPDWLEQRAWGIEDLLRNHGEQLAALSEEGVDLLAGGPPCQGFSFAGLRKPDDPRNLLFRRYLDAVRLIRPRAVLLENVPGMAVAHGAASIFSQRPKGGGSGSFLDALLKELCTLGYDVEGKFLDASRFGVPQRRTRLIVIGVLRQDEWSNPAENLASQVFERIEAMRLDFLKSLGLRGQVPAIDAIGDLSIVGASGKVWELQECPDPASARGFLEVVYDGRRSRSKFQQLMRRDMPNGPMDSMRLARHTDEVRNRFKQIQQTCRQGVQLNPRERATFKLKKHRIAPMAANEPSPTLTTLPDDVLHYGDPRILTVREFARLQSFPDWFVFKGKYTTGGNRRTRECPRYTQVGNAVPPLLGQAVGCALREVLDELGGLSSAAMGGAPGDKVDVVCA